MLVLPYPSPRGEGKEWETIHSACVKKFVILVNGFISEKSVF
jgi:hypothetical protein